MIVFTCRKKISTSYSFLLFFSDFIRDNLNASVKYSRHFFCKIKGENCTHIYIYIYKITHIWSNTYLTFFSVSNFVYTRLFTFLTQPVSKQYINFVSISMIFHVQLNSTYHCRVEYNKGCRGSSVFYRYIWLNYNMVYFTPFREAAKEVKISS